MLNLLGIAICGQWTRIPRAVVTLDLPMGTRAGWRLPLPALPELALAQLFATQSLTA